jgi:hypothetical protein
MGIGKSYSEGSQSDKWLDENFAREKKGNDDGWSMCDHSRYRMSKRYGSVKKKSESIRLLTCSEMWC